MKPSYALFSLAALAAACSSASPTQEHSTVIAADGGTSAQALVSSQVQWRRDVSKTPAPKVGCFRASQPSTTLEEVSCGDAPTSPHRIPASLLAQLPGSKPPVATGADAVPTGRAKLAPQTVNGGNDSNPAVQGLLKWAEGSFPLETGGSESDNNSSANISGANSYSLQMNTNLLTSPACSTSSSAGCRGWEQLIYDPLKQQAYFEFSLVGYGGSCPGPFVNSYTSSGLQVCYFNTSPAFVPGVLPTNLAGPTTSDITNLSMVGSTNGTTDTITMTVAGESYVTNQPSVLGLANGWNEAEFNVYGEDNGTQATFNGNTTLAVQVLTESLVPTTVPPSCFTGVPNWATVESNTLNVVPNSCCAFGGAQPGIQFLESNVAGTAAPQCPTLTTYSNPLSVPQGDFNTTWTVMNGQLVGSIPDAAILPSTCTAAASSLSFANITSPGGVQTFKFGAPLSLPVGTKVNVPIQCDTGSFTQQVVVTAQNPLNTAALSAGNDPLQAVTGGGIWSANIVLTGPWQTADNGAGATVVVTSNPIASSTLLSFPSGGPVDGDGIIDMGVTTNAETPIGTYTIGLLITDKASGVEIATNVQVEVICLPSSNVCVAASDGAPMCGNHAAGCGTTVDCGTCPGGAACGANGYCPCVPTFTSCSSAQTCGSVTNNCGQTFECGTCSGSATCSDNVCCPAGEVNSNGVCCPSGETGGDGVCCAGGDVPTSGHCCPSGDVWTGTECATKSTGGGGGGGCRCTKTECTCE